jgi:flagellar motor switch protein FliN
MTTDEALVQLGQSTAEAVASVLAMYAPDSVEIGGVSVLSGDQHPFDAMPLPAVLCSIAYVDGVTGGNVFAISLKGARALAAAMMGAPPPEDEATELDEMELSAVGEAMNQMMAASAGATSTVVGQEVEIDSPETRVVTTADELRAAYVGASHATNAALTICGYASRLVQLVPNAFLVRMMRALDESAAEVAGDHPVAAGDTPGLGVLMSGVKVRVWAELGRTRLPVGRVVDLPPGALVELDRDADAPIDIYVNGLRFATGRLVIDGTEWAVRIQELVNPADPLTASPTMEGAVP